MSSPFRTPEFLELKNKWYKKLEDKGFKDVEQDEDHLKQWHSSYFKHPSHVISFEAKEEYYRLAGQFTYEHKFKNKTESFIWQQHSDGVTMPKIVDKFRKKGIKINLAKVHGIIHRLADEMIKKACT